MQIENDAKIAIHSTLVVYLIESSATMRDTVDALALDSMQVIQVDLLNESLNYAKILLTKVINLSINGIRLRLRIIAGKNPVILFLLERPKPPRKRLFLGGVFGKNAIWKSFSAECI
jgi:hypothetical protein